MSKVILFQGDSITDAGRNKGGNQTCMGQGYPNLIKAYLGTEKPTEYEFVNRGVSGNRVLDLYARVVKDMIMVKPDYMSILIGVNDVWHGLDHQNGTGVARFEKVYDLLIQDLKTEMPDLKIMILEPFVLRGTATQDREDQPDRWETFRRGVAELAVIARMTAAKHHLKFVPLQEKFDVACADADPSYWLSDGVHPTPMGHEIIKRAWLKAFNELEQENG